MAKIQPKRTPPPKARQKDQVPNLQMFRDSGNANFHASSCCRFQRITTTPEASRYDQTAKKTTVIKRELCTNTLSNQFQCVPYFHSFLCKSVVCQKITPTHSATTNRDPHEKRTAHTPPDTPNHTWVFATSVTLWCVCRDKKKSGTAPAQKLDRRGVFPRNCWREVAPDARD